MPFHRTDCEAAGKRKEMKIFDLDSPVMRFFTRISELMIVNLLTLVCCIPIVTIGPALAAAHYTLLKLARDEYSYVTKTYFKGFKDNFKQGMKIGLLLIGLAVLLWYDYFLVTESGFAFGETIRVLLIVVMVIVVMTAIWIFPIMAKFENTVWGTIRNAFVMSILQLHKTVLMAILHIIPVYIFAFVPALWPVLLLLGISVPLYWTVKLYNKNFLVIEANVWAAQEGENPVQEEEDDPDRIFSDKLDETLHVDNMDVTPIIRRNEEPEDCSSCIENEKNVVKDDEKEEN